VTRLSRLQQSAGFEASFGPVPASDGERDVVDHAAVGEQETVLEDHPDATGLGGDVNAGSRVGEGVAVENHATSEGPHDPGDGAEGQRLARSGWPPQDGDARPSSEGRRDGEISGADDDILEFEGHGAALE
jgi:hypothetical protein